MKNRDTRSQKSAVSGVDPSVRSVMNETYAEKKAKALAAKNTTVMTYEELERIKGMCSQTNEQEDYKTMRQNERQDKRMLSQARVSKWPNTIQAERERKEYERIKKLEDDEVSICKLATCSGWPFFGLFLISYIFADREKKNRR